MALVKNLNTAVCSTDLEEKPAKITKRRIKTMKYALNIKHAYRNIAKNRFERSWISYSGTFEEIIDLLSILKNMTACTGVDVTVSYEIEELPFE